MNNLIPRTEKNPNPQGKGTVPILQDWAALRPQLTGEKSPGDILKDYGLSALVLAATFRFRPVPGKRYYLYSEQQEWKLSLIAPEEWGKRMPGEFVASCCLLADMTWQLDFCQLCEDSVAREHLQRFFDGFAETIAGQESIVDGLPFYESGLPYYQRMLATGLAASLQYSLGKIDTASLAQYLPTRLAYSESHVTTA